MHTITSPRRSHLAVALAAALLLTACGGDAGTSDEAADAEPETAVDAQDVAEDAQEMAEDAEQLTEDAAEQLEDAGVDTDSQDAYAEVVFEGETLRIPADDSFGCFLAEDGGSDGALDFTGSDEAGNEISVGWAGDTPEASSLISLTLADGSEWRTDAPLDVTISGSTSAEVSATLTSLDGSGSEADIVVRATCP